ncbi:hypothetical protein LCGC14_1307700 [marine sediment metagenome]|uniref:ClpX-type ZB domain-containing protein n=1 Tax=marine sediment metagenome TaxID=412755 RepID=A0A0F9KNB1_9ZZZZ
MKYAEKDIDVCERCGKRTMVAEMLGVLLVCRACYRAAAYAGELK